MSGKRVNILRKQFEETTGFTPYQRDSEMYKSEWRKFKKNKKWR